MTLAIYPGSFDPVTCGHLDIIERASQLFDHVIVAVLENTAKQPMFTTSERTSLLTEVVRPYPGVSVETFHGLTAEYARMKGAKILIRGLRAVSDFDSELHLALANKRLNPTLETVFLMTSSENLFLSSSLVREIATMGGNIRGMVPPAVELALLEKLPA